MLITKRLPDHVLVKVLTWRIGQGRLLLMMILGSLHKKQDLPARAWLHLHPLTDLHARDLIHYNNISAFF